MLKIIGIEIYVELQSQSPVHWWAESRCVQLQVQKVAAEQVDKRNKESSVHIYLGLKSDKAISLPVVPFLMPMIC